MRRPPNGSRRSSAGQDGISISPMTARLLLRPAPPSRSTASPGWALMRPSPTTPARRANCSDQPADRRWTRSPAARVHGRDGATRRRPGSGAHLLQQLHPRRLHAGLCAPELQARLLGLRRLVIRSRVCSSLQDFEGGQPQRWLDLTSKDLFAGATLPS